MRRHGFLPLVMITLLSAGLASQTKTDGPYKVLKTAKVGNLKSKVSPEEWL